MRHAALACLLLLLAACTGTSQEPAADRYRLWITACEGYGRSLITLGTARGQGLLTVATVDKVERLQVLIDPVCPPAPMPTTQALFDQLQASAGELAALAATAGAR